MRSALGAACVLGAFAAQSGEAVAGIDRAYLGVLAHNIQVIDGKNAGKEDGPAVELQVNFSSPGFLRWAGSPEPYVVGSLNVAGETSFAGVGLEWNWEFAEGWALSPALGYVVHDGELNNPYANGTPEAAAFFEEHVLLGSRDLFRSSIGLSREFGGGWSGQVFYSHLSHGQILGEGRNQGLDQAGLRVGKRFGD
jgi:lipid A 3-O-deacylase